MKLKLFAGLLVITLAVLAGCQGNGEPQVNDKKETGRRPGLHKLEIGDFSVYVDIAANPPSRQQGLMFVKELHEDEGMLFVYPDSDYRSFWMKNTFIPLSIAYIDEKGKIIEIIDMKPHDESGHPSSLPAVYALEVNKGWFRRKGIEAGDLVINLPDPGGAE